jgi:hypothetical protein
MRRECWVLLLALTAACAGEKPGADTRAPDSAAAGQAGNTAGAVRRDSTAPPADTVMARDTARQL